MIATVNITRSDMPEITDGMLVNDYYIVKRAVFPNFTADDTEDIDYWYDSEDDTVIDIDIDDFYPLEEDEFLPIDGEEGRDNKMIEAAVFLDHVGYQRLSQVSTDRTFLKYRIYC